MTHQQKAEAYVREMLPELRELSGGCNEDFQLQHWLRVLPWGERDFYFLPAGFLCDKEQENKLLVTFDMNTGQPATQSDYQAFNDIVGI